MKIALLCDEHIPYGIVTALRLRGEEITHVEELGRKGLSDSEHLEFAAQHDFAFFTYDVPDFIILHKHYVQQGKHHAGLIFAQELSISEAVRRLSEFLQYHDRLSVADNVWYI
jgi:predicted nuclease of predicted toxin-antitoxin system